MISILVVLISSVFIIGAGAYKPQSIALENSKSHDLVEVRNEDDISIYGENDGVIDFENLEASKEKLPEDTKFLEIKGGNHGLVGDYGFQDGDNEATITL